MCHRSGHFLHLPEREDDNSGNYKDDSKNHKDGISSLMPFGVVQYLCTLKNKNRKDSAMVAVMIILQFPRSWSLFSIFLFSISCRFLRSFVSCRVCSELRTWCFLQYNTLVIAKSQCSKCMGTRRSKRRWPPAVCPNSRELPLWEFQYGCNLKSKRSSAGSAWQCDGSPVL